MKLSLFDLHCDTAGEMLRQGQTLFENDLAVSLQKASVFQRYIQVMAHYTPFELGDEEGWLYFLKMHENLKNDPAIQNNLAFIKTDSTDRSHLPMLLLSVEDARILCGKLERIDTLYQMGIRIITPLWKGETVIGGSHDTEVGLTQFGTEALRRAAELGMILDISHASRRAAEEIFSIADEKRCPVIASHSNSYDICPVSRNLRAEQVQAILKADGLIGINLYKFFLKENGEATSLDVLRHIDRLLELGAKDHLALGCDMDGCDLPPDIPSVSALPHLARQMALQGFGNDLIDAIFFENAHRFAKKYIFS